MFQMVLLGFLDEPRGGKMGDDDDDPSNWTISRIGGQPVSMHRVDFCSNREFHLGLSEFRSFEQVEIFARLR